MALHHLPESEPPARGLREDDPVIEALRGCAALMVMATHYIQLLTREPGLWGFASTGVDLFFVLSGYVFAPYLFGRSLQIAPHLIRRFFRLYPLYVCALLLYVGLRLPAASAWDHFAVHLAMGHTLASLQIANYYNAAFWSLPPEVEYYLLLPLLAWGAARGRWSGQRFVWLLLLAAAAHLLLVAAAVPDEGISARRIATIHVPGVLIEFMWGSMAYALLQRADGARARAWRLVLGLLVLAGMAALFNAHIAPVGGSGGEPPPWIGGNIGFGAALGYALLVSALAGAGRQPPPAGARPWLRSSFLFMGQLSYGVYLFHNAAPQLLRRALPDLAGLAAVAACAAITLLLAWAAHHAIERPLRNYGRRLSQSFSR